MANIFQMTFSKILLKFVPKALINNITSLVLIMAWRRPGGKPLSEPMVVYWRIYAASGTCMTQLLYFTHLYYCIVVSSSHFGKVSFLVYNFAHHCLILCTLLPTPLQLYFRHRQNILRKSKD